MAHKADSEVVDIVFGVGGAHIVVPGKALFQYRSGIDTENIRIYKIEGNKAFFLSTQNIGKMTEAEMSGLRFGLKKADFERLKQRYAETLSKDSYYEQLQKKAALSIAEQAAEIKELRSIFFDITKSADAVDVKAGKIIGVLNESILINNAVMHLKIDPKDWDGQVLKEQLQADTRGIIQSVYETIGKSELSVKLIHTLHELSNGQTVRHMTNVFLLVNNFLQYFNRLMSSQSAFLSIKNVFSKRYAPLYARLLPSLDLRVLQPQRNILFLESIPSENSLLILLGAYLHDAGKIEDLEYFEGAAGRDRERIQKHVLIGYELIRRFWGGDFYDAALIAGLHHEYNDHADGYGIHSLNKLISKKEKVKAVTNNYREYESGTVCSFFPAMVTAIADVYEALTDSSRKYRGQKTYTTTEALAFMQEIFVLQGKLDPVLFDIFIESLRWQGVETPMQLGLHRT